MIISNQILRTIVVAALMAYPITKITDWWMPIYQERPFYAGFLMLLVIIPLGLLQSTLMWVLDVPDADTNTVTFITVGILIAYKTIWTIGASIREKSNNF